MTEPTPAALDEIEAALEANIACSHNGLEPCELCSALIALSAARRLVEAARGYQVAVETPVFDDDRYIRAGDALRAALAGLEQEESDAD